MASTLLSPMVDYYNDEEELDSVDDDDDRSFRGRDSEEGTVKRIDQKLRLGLLVGKETETRDYCINSDIFCLQCLKCFADFALSGRGFSHSALFTL